MITKTASLKCPECGATHNTVQLLAMHRRQAHGVKGTSRSAVRKALLDKHLAAMKAPAHPKPNQCPICGFKLENKAGLSIHLAAIHKTEPTPEQIAKTQEETADPKAANSVYQCPHCEFIGADQGGLALHRRKKHNEITAVHPKKNMRRELEPTQAQTITVVSNGHQENWQGHTDGIPEALIAVTSGRFQELCRSVAYEHDLPPRLFAARVAAFVYGTTLR